MDEMYYQRGKTVSLTFGKPVEASVFDNRHNDGKWAEMMKEHVYSLKSTPNKIFHAG